MNIKNIVKKVSFIISIMILTQNILMVYVKAETGSLQGELQEMMDDGTFVPAEENDNSESTRDDEISEDIFQSAGKVAAYDQDMQQIISVPEQNTYEISINHGMYDEITEEAINNYNTATIDGKADSCYIDVVYDSKTNLLFPATAIYQNFKNREDGFIRYYTADENGEYSRMLYEIHFYQNDISKIENFNEWHFDTYLDIQKNNSSKYKGTYQLVFRDERELPFIVGISFLTEEENTKYYIYTTNQDNGYALIAEVTSDENGYISFDTNSLMRYTVSSTDIIAEIEREKNEAEKNSIIEGEQLDNEKAAQQEKVDILKEKRENSNIIESMTVAELNSIFYKIAIGVGCVIIGGIIFYYYIIWLKDKKHKLENNKGRSNNEK